VDAGALLLVISCLGPAGLPAPPPARQAPSAAAPAAPAPARWEVGFEYQRDRFDYRFENASNFGTPETVPHVFEQRYGADNAWLSARLFFTLGNRPFETEGGLSTGSTGIGSDYDTFYQPDGDIVRYGTTAVTDIRSWRAAQYVGLGWWLGVRWRAAYGYRRDHADFRPSFTTILHTTPPSSAAFWNADRETTISEVHEIRLGAERVFAWDSGWCIRAAADAAPTTLARLTTLLPDKYPEPVVFIAKSLSVNAALSVTRRTGRWHVGAVLAYAQAWSYRQSDAYHRRAISVAGVVGR
jgi:hypothetical protein